MKVLVTLEFATREEAAAFLGGNVPAAATTVTTTAATGGKGKGKKADLAVVPPPVPAFDKAAALKETSDTFTAILKDATTGNAHKDGAERQAYLIGLISKHGGTGKAGTIPDAKYPAFLEELKAYHADLESAPEEPETQESLI